MTKSRGFSRRVHPKVPRRKSEWLAAASGGCSARLTLSVCGTDPFPDPDLFSLVENPTDANPGQVDSVGEVTIVRLVGEVWCTSTALAAAATGAQQSTVAFYAGIFINDEPSVQGSFMDPVGSEDMASKDWLWRGLVIHDHFGNDGQITTQQSSQFVGGANDHHLDIKVKRKVRKEESIILAVTALVDVLEGNRLTHKAFIYADLRALVLLP